MAQRSGDNSGAAPFFYQNGSPKPWPGRCGASPARPGRNWWRNASGRASPKKTPTCRWTHWAQRWPAAASAATCGTPRASPSWYAANWAARRPGTASTRRCAASSNPVTRQPSTAATWPRPPGLHLPQLLVPEERWRRLSRSQRALRPEDLHQPRARSGDRQALGHAGPGPPRHQRQRRRPRRHPRHRLGHHLQQPGQRPARPTAALDPTPATPKAAQATAQPGALPRAQPRPATDPTTTTRVT